MEAIMLELILLVFGACFLGITLLVIIGCVLFGSKDVRKEYEEELRMRRFMREYMDRAKN